MIFPDSFCLPEDMITSTRSSPGFFFIPITYFVLSYPVCSIKELLTPHNLFSIKNIKTIQKSIVIAMESYYPLTDQPFYLWLLEIESIVIGIHEIHSVSQALEVASLIDLYPHR